MVDVERVEELLSARLRAEEERDALRERLRPIPVSERLPDEAESVLVWDATSKFWDISSQFRGGSWVGEASQVFTHWLPLPPNPE